jgi:type I restriction enzyme S subunit
MIGRYGPPLFQILRGLDGAYNVALVKAIPDERQLSKDFLFYFLKNREILSYIIHSSSRAAGQSGLNKETIEPYPIAFPSLARQVEIVCSLRKCEQECERLEAYYEQKQANLADLKQSILQKAFSGELSSPPSQAIKEAAE